MATAAFLTEDSYLGEIMRPLTLNRYGYCLGILELPNMSLEQLSRAEAGAGKRQNGLSAGLMEAYNFSALEAVEAAARAALEKNREYQTFLR